jgi:hypothetical protein
MTALVLPDTSSTGDGFLKQQQQQRQQQWRFELMEELDDMPDVPAVDMVLTHHKQYNAARKCCYSAWDAEHIFSWSRLLVAAAAAVVATAVAAVS